MSKYGNKGTKGYAVKAPRKQHTVTTNGPQRQIQHGDERKSPFGNKYLEQGENKSLYMDDLKLLSRSENDLEN